MALSVIGTLRGRLLARDAVSSKGKRASARNTMKAPNNQSPQHFATIRPHNAIVIMQTTPLLCHKQRKRDNTNNASVIMANRRAHNAIVISRFRRQAFVTFCNISSACLSHRLGLYGALVLCDSSGLAQVQTYYLPIDKLSLWKGQTPIRGAYMISAAYGSALNDKFCL
jgi:hypothetical protein